MVVLAWRCPVCSDALTDDGSGAVCASRHRFDRAREGYINLLPANHRGSRDPGDSAEMVRARRNFLDAGHYAPLARRVADTVLRTLPADARMMVDVGCGEGYYTARIANAFRTDNSSARVAGLDVSKDAVRLAAKRYRELDLVVASSFRIPIADAVVDTALMIFAPASIDELARIVRPGGHVLIVQPGPDHLFALRERVYATPTRHRDDPPDLGDSFETIEKERIVFSVNLCTQSDIAALFAMTPYFWKASQERRDALAELNHLDTRAQFEVLLFRRTT